MTQAILADLQWRGLVHQCTDLVALEAALLASPVTLYCGFDPTATSLHVGSLIPLITLQRFRRAGHRAIALVGGATGLIGDPSGKSAERVLQTSQGVATQAALIHKQMQPFVGGDVLDNLSWTQNMSLLDFLRDVGKHFSVNAMIRRDSISSRLEREGDGISFTEFSYMLLQAFDFLKLAELEGCSLQIGGSDQWGNMCSGVDLVRRELGKTAFALTLPLLTTSDGQKFGKTVKGAVWLDASLTSPWEFSQFWLNTQDSDVVRLLKLFTFVARDEIEALERDTAERPQARNAQKRLAAEMTELVHGAHEAEQARHTGAVLFGTAAADGLTVSTLESLMIALPSTKLAAGGVTPKLAALLVKLGLEASMSKANQVAAAGAVSVNNVPRLDGNFVAEDDDWIHGRFLLVKKGKKSFALVERS